MALTNKLKAIADAIREKTGSTEPMTLDGMVENILTISGSSGGSGGTTQLDKTVEFVNNDVTVAITTITDGCAIGKLQLSGVSNWMDETNTIVDFPYTPVANVVLTGVAKSYADELYELYSDIDREVYPYIVIIHYSGGITIYFAQEYKSSGNLRYAKKENFNGSYSNVLSEVINVIKSNKTGLGSLSTDNSVDNENTSYTYFANFEYPSVNLTRI